MIRKFLLLVLILHHEMVWAQWEIKNIDANNINAPVEADGFLFHNTTTDASFEVPKFSGKYCIYSSNLWMGGLDQNGILHLAAQTYKQNGTDFWPAPLLSNGNTNQPSLWNKVWHIDKSSVDNHISNYNTQGYQLPQELIDWPGSGYNGINQVFAPYVDINNNGTYDPSYGDYPNVPGDEALYIMYNDKYSSHSESGGIPVEAEIYSTIYAYNATGSTTIDNTLFIRHRIRNRSQVNTYSNFYVGIWNDFDIGDPFDDLIGTDINRNMVYGYNADSYDSIYGNNPPAVGVKILNHSLHNSMFYDNIGTAFYGNNPTSPNHYYNYLRSFWKDDLPLNFGNEGYQTPFGTTPYCFSGNTNPNFAQNWEMTTPKDYRIIASAGPFTIAPNGYITIDVAYIYAKGNNNSLSELSIAADVVQNYYSATINNLDESQLEQKQFISPNPAETSIFIDYHVYLHEAVTYSIYDISGMLVFTETQEHMNHHNIDISTLAPGIYFIDSKSKQFHNTQKFIKR